MQRAPFAIVYLLMRSRWLPACLCFVASSAVAQIQVDLKFPQLQYVAYEPIVVNLTITNLAGREIALRSENGQAWLGFEITGDEDRAIAPISSMEAEPLNLTTCDRVSQKINLTPLFGVHDYGTYHVRAHIYFGNLNKFFYSQTKVFEVTAARPIWQKTVGVPEGNSTGGNARTYSLMTNRFPDHTSLYVRVEDKDSGIVYATYSLGQVIAFDEPQAEFDRSNKLHVLYCAAPRNWAYARIGLNGELLSRASFAETKTHPRLVHSDDGVVRVSGGVMDRPVSQAAPETAPKLSARSSSATKNN